MNKDYYNWLVMCSVSCSDILTHDLNVNNSCVHVIFYLHFHLILPRMATLCFANENDAVAVCVTDANMGRLYGLSVLRPDDLRPGFSLQTSHRVELI